MLTVRGQQHSFSTHERMFLWKCQIFFVCFFRYLYSWDGEQFSDGLHSVFLGGVVMGHSHTNQYVQPADKHWSIAAEQQKLMQCSCRCTEFILSALNQCEENITEHYASHPTSPPNSPTPTTTTPTPNPSTTIISLMSSQIPRRWYSLAFSYNSELVVVQDHQTLLLLTRLQLQFWTCCRPRSPDIVATHSPSATILNLFSSKIIRRCCYSPAFSYNPELVVPDHQTLLLLTHLQIQFWTCCHPRSPNTVAALWPAFSYNSELVVVPDPQTLLLLTSLQLQFWTCCRPRSPDVVATHQPSATILNLLSSQIPRRCCYSPAFSYNFELAVVQDPQTLILTRLRLQSWTCCRPGSPDVDTHPPSATILNLLSSRIPRLWYSPAFGYNPELVVVQDPQTLILTRLRLQSWTCCHHWMLPRLPTRRLRFAGPSPWM